MQLAFQMRVYGTQSTLRITGDVEVEWVKIEAWLCCAGMCALKVVMQKIP